MKEAIKKTGRSAWVTFWLVVAAIWPFAFLLSFLGLTSSGALQLGEKYSMYFVLLLGFSMLYLFIFSGIIKQIGIITRTVLFSTVLTSILVYLAGSVFGYFPAFW